MSDSRWDAKADGSPAASHTGRGAATEGQLDAGLATQLQPRHERAQPRRGLGLNVGKLHSDLFPAVKLADRHGISQPLARRPTTPATRRYADDAPQYGCVGEFLLQTLLLDEILQRACCWMPSVGLATVTFTIASMCRNSGRGRACRYRTAQA